MERPAPDYRSSDAAIVELLRGDVALGIADMAKSLGVTATAVRQRLDRLMKSGLVGRRQIAKPRGRPAHAYSLTDQGRQIGGDNFRDLAMVLWREIRGVRDASVRQGLLGRIGVAMADVYRSRMTGETPGDRLQSIAALLAEREIPCAVESGSLPVLTSYACPYPDLAEQDRGICAAERLMLQELVGSSVQLSECRLDGAPCCRFMAGGEIRPGGGSEDPPAAGESRA
jgi:predicted ArsR family transcriptional regulator